MIGGFMPGAVGAGSKSPVRRWERFKADIPVRVIVQDDQNVKIFDGRGRTLSEGGVAVFVGAELRPGAQVAVEFTPPYADSPIRVAARVCNRTGYHYGLEFVTATKVEKQQAEEFHRHLATLVQPAAG